MLVFLVAMLITLSVIFLVGAGASVVNGITLSIIWGWFMVPIFGLPALNVPQAIAVTLVVGFFFPTASPQGRARGQDRCREEGP